MEKNNKISKDLIGALVLTKDRKKMAEECIKKLLKIKKIKKIILVINGESTDNYPLSSKYEKNKKVIILELPKNFGSAGGYKEGLKKALKEKIAWLWLFDEDCEPLENSFDELIKAKEFLKRKKEKISYLSSSLKWLDGGNLPIKICLENPFWAEYLSNSLIEIKWSVFTGLFINMRILKEKDLPKKDLFIYSDDTIFTYNLSKKGRGFLVGKSKILHKDYSLKRRNYTPITSNKELLRRTGIYLRNSIYFSKILIKSKEKNDKKDAIRIFLGSLKNSFMAIINSRRFYYLPLILQFLIRGLFFNPKD
ncbi:MAG: glycosyltransferase [Candidatus Pacearchaeota archaeon]